VELKAAHACVHDGLFGRVPIQFHIQVFSLLSCGFVCVFSNKTYYIFLSGEKLAAGGEAVLASITLTAAPLAVRLCWISYNKEMCLYSARDETTGR
jgi:hypothetical protein